MRCSYSEIFVTGLQYIVINFTMIYIFPYFHFVNQFQCPSIYQAVHFPSEIAILERLHDLSLLRSIVGSCYAWYWKFSAQLYSDLWKPFCHFAIMPDILPLWRLLLEQLVLIPCSMRRSMEAILPFCHFAIMSAILPLCQLLLEQLVLLPCSMRISLVKQLFSMQIEVL